MVEITDQERLERAVEAVRSRTSCNRRAVLVAFQRLLQFSGRPRSPTKCRLQVCAQLQGDTDSEAVWATIELDDWAELVSIVSSQGRQTRGRDHLEKERRIQEALADAQRVFPGRNLRPALEQLIDQYIWDNWPFLSANNHEELIGIVAAMQDGGTPEQHPTAAPDLIQQPARTPPAEPIEQAASETAPEEKAVTQAKALEEGVGTPEGRAVPGKEWVSWPVARDCNLGAWEDRAPKRKAAVKARQEWVESSSSSEQDECEESPWKKVKTGRRDEQGVEIKEGNESAPELRPPRLRDGSIPPEEEAQAARFLSLFHPASNPKSPKPRGRSHLSPSPRKKAPASSSAFDSQLKQTSMLNYVSPRKAPAVEEEAAPEESQRVLESRRGNLGRGGGSGEAVNDAGPSGKPPPGRRRIVIDLSSEHSDSQEPKAAHRRGPAEATAQPRNQTEVPHKEDRAVGPGLVRGSGVEPAGREEENTLLALRSPNRGGRRRGSKGRRLVSKVGPVRLEEKKQGEGEEEAASQPWEEGGKRTGPEDGEAGKSKSPSENRGEEERTFCAAKDRENQAVEEHGAEVLRAHSQGGKGPDMGRKWTPPAGAGKRWRSHTMTIHSNSSEDFNGAAANRVEKGPAACGDDNITGGVNADQIATSHWDSNAGQNRLEEPGRSVAAASVVAPPWGMEASRLLHVGGIPEGAKRAVCGALEQWLVELVCECGERLPHSGDRIVSNTEHLADQPGQLVVRLKSPELLTLCLEKAKGRRIGGYDVRLSRVRWNGSKF